MVAIVDLTCRAMSGGSWCRKEMAFYDTLALPQIARKNGYNAVITMTQY